jgi:hypothetical protein
MLNREELLYVGIKVKGIFVSDTQTSNITERQVQIQVQFTDLILSKRIISDIRKNHLSKHPEKNRPSPTSRKIVPRSMKKDPVEYPENQKPKIVLLRLGIRYQEKTYWLNRLKKLKAPLITGLFYFL